MSMKNSLYDFIGFFFLKKESTKPPARRRRRFFGAFFSDIFKILSIPPSKNPRNLRKGGLRVKPGDLGECFACPEHALNFSRKFSRNFQSQKL